MRTQPSSATDPSATFAAALAEGDFERLATSLAPDVRMRALIPPGPVEASGANAAAAKFAAWFGGAEEVELVRSGSDAVADRLHIFYTLRVKRPGEGWKLVEQHVLCTLENGNIAAFDLVCTGFRPDAGKGRQGLVR